MGKQKNNLIYFLLSLVAAAFAAIIGVRTINAFMETTPVVVAVRDIEPFQKITADDITIRDVPTIMVNEYTVLNREEVVNAYTKSAIYRGQVLDKRALARAQGEQSMLAAQLNSLNDPTIRAFAIPYDASTAVGGEIRAGDRVDIIAQVKIDAGGGVSMGVGKVIAAAVQVLKVVPQGEGKGNLILALRPTEIENIAFAMTSGTLRFALNPLQTDPTAAKTPGVTGAQWLQNQGFTVTTPNYNY